MRLSLFFKLSWGALLLVLVAFAAAQPLNVRADVRQTTPTTEGTQAATPASTAAVDCPQIPVTTEIVEPTDAVDATPTVSEAGYLGIAAENSIDGCGAKVVDLDPDGPATKAGVKLNDVIYGAASLETRSVDKLKALIRSLPADSMVSLYIIRNKQPIVLRVTLVSFTAAHAIITPTLPATATPESTAEATQAATSEPTQASTEQATPSATSEGTPTS